MKRIVIGSFAQCMEVVSKSEHYGCYDFYEMAETTKQEYSKYVQGWRQTSRNKQTKDPDDVVYNRARVKHFWETGNLYTLCLYADK